MSLKPYRRLSLKEEIELAEEQRLAGYAKKAEVEKPKPKVEAGKSKKKK